MPVRELPYEVWAKIVGMVPTHIMKRLYHINSVFLEGGLNARYGEITLFEQTMSVKIARKFMLHLLQPHIRHRIRSLKIRSITFDPILPYTLYARSSLYRAAFGLPSTLATLMTSDFAKPSVFDLATQLFPEATRVATLDLQGHSSLSQEYFDVATSAWSCLSNRLQILSFRGSIIEFAKLFCGVPQFPHLRALKVQIMKEAPSAYVNFGLRPNPNAKYAWVEFLRSVSSTLKELSIMVDYQVGEDIISEEILSHILQSFRPTLLHSFKCDLSGQPMFLFMPHLLEFICRVSNALQELAIPGYGASDMPELRFGHLKSLMITDCRGLIEAPSFPVFGTAEIYLKRCPDLTSLALLGNHLPLEALDGFLRRHQMCGTFQLLRTLELSIHWLSPQILLILAETLPELERLTLQYFLITPHIIFAESLPSMGMTANLKRFRDQWTLPEETQTLLSNWRLVYLGIRPRSRSITVPHEAHLLMQVLPQLIPSCGVEILQRLL